MMDAEERALLVAVAEGVRSLMVQLTCQPVEVLARMDRLIEHVKRPTAPTQLHLVPPEPDDAA